MGCGCQSHSLFSWCAMHLIAKENGLHPSLHILYAAILLPCFSVHVAGARRALPFAHSRSSAICTPIRVKTRLIASPFSGTEANMDGREANSGEPVALVSGRRAADGGRSQVHAKSPDRRTFSSGSTASIQPSSFRNDDKYLSLLRLGLLLNSASQFRLQLIAGPWKRVT